MKFDDPEVIESICYQMRLAEYPRGKNRTLINNLFNGFPPYSEDEVEENGININVNFLEGTRLSHDVRSQFYQSILKPGNYFTCRTDSGPVHKRSAWGAIVTEEISKIMKRSMVYTESQRSKIAMNVLHGIAPCGWRDDESWCPYAMGVEDVFVPAGTLLTMENLPFFVLYRQFSAPELVKIINKPNRDPAWNIRMLKAAIKWVDSESKTLMNNNWPEIWAPEKLAERVKGDGGMYYGDQVPTVNVFDFYFWNDAGKTSGWNRRMILDGWSMPESFNYAETPNPTRKADKFHGGYRRQFLYNPGDRKVALDRSEILNWQFAALSAVAPFRYHSVRSLGFLLYSVCHLQNRLRCKFNEAVFEQLMMYFRVNTELDAQRSLKVELVNKGFIDDSVKFIPAAERYQVNTTLAQLGLAQNQNIINQNSSSYTVQPQSASQPRDRTKFEVMAEVNAVQSLVSSAISQALIYQVPEFREIFRRLTIKNSSDPDSRRFQANCLRRGVSERVLYNRECWEQDPSRVLGDGNKTMELAIAEQLMAYRNLYDPEPQRDILREVTLAITNDPAKAMAYVPENPVKVTDSVHDAQLAAGALMQGLPVAIKTGMNHIEYVDTLMQILAQQIEKFRQSQSIPTMEQLQGMVNVAQHIEQHIQVIAQDKAERQRVKIYGDQLGKMQNVLKGFGQQLMEQQQAQAQQGGQVDPEVQAKIHALMIQAQTKAEANKTAHAQKTAQRQISWEREEMRKDEALKAQLSRDNLATDVELQQSTLEASHDMSMTTAEAAHALEVDKIREAKKPAPKKVDTKRKGD